MHVETIHPSSTYLSLLVLQKYMYVVIYKMCFPCGSVIKESACSAGDTGSIPGNPLQCCCLGNAMDRGAWWTTVHRVTKSSVD